MTYYGPPAYPQPPLPPAGQAPANGVGTAALVCGMCALVMCWIPVVGIIAWPLGIAGVLLGVVGWARARNGSADNLGMAIAGTATAGLALVVCVVWLIAFGAAVSSPSSSAAGYTPTYQMPTYQAPSYQSPTQARPTPSPAPKRGPATTVSDGVYEVGVDVVGGRYKTPGQPADAISSGCYWARTKDDSGQSNAIISSGFSAGPGSVTVKNGEFFTTSGGCTWTKQ